MEPALPEEAWTFIDALESRETAVRTDVDSMTFGIFKRLCLVAKAAGNAISDALLASIAIRHDATLATSDRGFGLDHQAYCPDKSRILLLYCLDKIKNHPIYRGAL